MTPWHLVVRYRWTFLFVTYVFYLMFVYRLVRGHW